MGEVIRELHALFDDHFFVRVYAENGDRWRAWLDFTSVRHGDLQRSPVLRTAGTREELIAWARDLSDDEIRRALDDSELITPRELGVPPPEAVRLR